MTAVSASTSAPALASPRVADGLRRHGVFRAVLGGAVLGAVAGYSNRLVAGLANKLAVGFTARIAGTAVTVAALLACGGALGACAPDPAEIGGPDGTATEPRFRLGKVSVSEAQACAIGWDLARQTHRHVSLRRTVILAPRRANSCERYALEYLRRAGFRIDATRQGGYGFDVELARTGEDSVSAVATIGASLRIARVYRLVRTGVVPLSGVSVQQLGPAIHALREPAA